MSRAISRIQLTSSQLPKVESGMVFWITGLSGAGKTTLGRILHERLRTVRGPGIVFLDGDLMREVLGATTAHSLEERKRLSQGYSRLCRMLGNQGLDVVCCTVSMFHDVRAWNRANMDRYHEIYVRVPLTVLHARDQKGLYSSAASNGASQLMGLNQTAEFPESPDLEVQNDGCRPPEAVVDEIWKAFFPQPEEASS